MEGKSDGSSKVAAWFALATCLWLAAGCHRMATVVDTEGMRYHAEIVGGTDKDLVLQPRGKRPFAVSRSSVVSLTWPGTAATYVGGSFMAAGVISLIVSATLVATEPANRDILPIGIATVAANFVIGLPALVWGVEATGDAMDKSRRPHKLISLRAAPYVQATRGGGTGGVRLSW